MCHVIVKKKKLSNYITPGLICGKWLLSRISISYFSSSLPCVRE